MLLEDIFTYDTRVLAINTHGVSTGNWGAGAWLGYNTAGLGVSTVAGQFMPSYTTPLENLGIDISPTIGSGSNGLNLGASIGRGYSDGNISLLGSVGFGTS